MDEPLEIAKKYLQAGEAEKAISVLKQTPNDQSEYIRLMAVCRNTLSEQYAYIIKEKLDKNQLSEVQDFIYLYQKNLGTDSIIKNFLSQLEQKESADNNLLAKISRIPLGKIADIVTTLFVVLTCIVILLGYIVWSGEWWEFLISGSIAGILIQTASFILYLSLVKNAVWWIGKRKIISYIFMAGFFFTITSLFIDCSDSTYDHTAWNYGIAVSFKPWKWINIPGSGLSIMGVFDIISHILYIIAFSLILKFGKPSFNPLCKCGIIFLSTPLALLLLPYLDDFLVFLFLGPIIAFGSWCYFFFILHKTIYNNY